jgi:adenine phosphoribosyltransferase/phosphomevalonate kinase
MVCSPSDLFDRELYMTAVFDPKQVLAPGVLPPTKLRSLKRCILDVDKLLHDRQYKELHRKALGDYYQQKKAQDVAYDARCFVEVIQRSTASIILLTGMRDGLEYARTLAGRTVVLVKVDATENSKQSRGWSADPEIDDSVGECSADVLDNDFWDLVYQNDSVTSTFETVLEWTLGNLAPAILKRCVRQLDHTPQPGIIYKDLIGGLMLQPFGMSLCTALMVHWLRNKNAHLDLDAVIAPEALGFVFASSLAAQLNKPLILVRKADKLPGHVTSVDHSGSNMSNLMDGSPDSRVSASRFEIVSGAIVPGQRVLAVDDCLASGSTMKALAHLISLQGGTISHFCFVMELPDLSGRLVLDKSLGGGNVYSLMKFSGR